MPQVISRRYLVISAVAALIGLNVWLELRANFNPIKGTYFSKGILINSKGDVLDFKVRILANKAGISDFEKVAENKLHFNYKFSKVELDNSVVFMSTGNPAVAKAAAKHDIDRDLAFNLYYITSADVPLTLNKIFSYGKTNCYYIKELQKVRCFGGDRI